ncbi:MAG: hypothetical protein ACFB51_08540, partial [Anaerolineae bacterium]
MRNLIALLCLSVLLAACGGQPTGEPTADQPAETEAAAPPTDPPTAEPAGRPLDPIAQAVYERAQNSDRVQATLFMLLAAPIEGGQQVVFQYEDEFNEQTIGCRGYALTLLQEDTTYSLSDISVACGPLDPGTPNVAFTPREPPAFVGEGG